MSSHIWEQGKIIQFKRDRQAQFSYDLVDSMKRTVTAQIEVFFTNNPSAKDIENLDQREGLRLNVGRFCTMKTDDQVIEAQILQYNADNTVVLRDVHTRELINDGDDIDVAKVQKIERYGVSVYDFDKLPE